MTFLTFWKCWTSCCHAFTRCPWLHQFTSVASGASQSTLHWLSKEVRNALPNGKSSGSLVEDSSGPFKQKTRTKISCTNQYFGAIELIPQLYPCPNHTNSNMQIYSNNNRVISMANWVESRALECIAHCSTSLEKQIFLRTIVAELLDTSKHKVM